MTKPFSIRGGVISPGLRSPGHTKIDELAVCSRSLGDFVYTFSSRSLGAFGYTYNNNLLDANVSSIACLAVELSYFGAPSMCGYR